MKDVVRPHSSYLQAALCSHGNVSRGAATYFTFLRNLFTGNERSISSISSSVNLRFAAAAFSRTG